MNTSRAIAVQRCHTAFTLIELLVTIVIISILSSLMLSGLAGARHRVKIEKTKATIRKLDEVILPLYNAYAAKRVPTITPNTSSQQQQLESLIVRRQLMAYELPDNWADVACDYQTPHWANWDGSPSAGITGVPPYVRGSSAARAYRAIRNAQSQARGAMPTAESGECLFSIVARSGLDPIALELFRTDEIGDVDQDSLPEFIDGFGNAIEFIRWPMGFPSPLGAAASRDPMDPRQLDASVANLLNTTAAVMVPLITSPGPDGELGLTVMDSWLDLNPASATPTPRLWRTLPPPAAAGTRWTWTTTGLAEQRPSTQNPYARLPGAYVEHDPNSPGAAEDNVHNHSLKR